MAPKVTAQPNALVPLTAVMATAVVSVQAPRPYDGMLISDLGFVTSIKACHRANTHAFAAGCREVLQ